MTRRFGTVEPLPSGRYRARYTGPDEGRYSAPTTFLTKRDARDWLAMQQTEIIRKAWEPPEASARAATTFADYAEQWMTQRELKARTREHYRGLLDAYLLPEFGSAALSAITADVVRSWYAHALVGKPTRRAHCYSLLRTILRTAAHDGKISTSPCVIKGAGTTKRVKVIRPATVDELAKITAEMPECYQAMIPLASWCGLRFGELTELRRKDLVLDPDPDPDKARGVVRVERAVVHVDNGFAVTTPKSDAGCRDVHVPPRLVAVLADHLARHVGSEPDALLFPAQHGGHLAPSTLYGRFSTAREKAGRPDLRFHDLRHTGAVLAALTGATIAELMARLGHSAPAAAMRYQHAAAGRDEQIAAALSTRIALGS